MLAGLALGLVAASWSLHGLGRWEVVLVLAVIANVAEGHSMRVSPRVEVSVLFMPLALAAVLFGPAAAAVVGGAAMLHREGPLERFLIYFSGKTLAGCAAGWSAVLAERIASPDSLVTLVAVAAVASVVGTGVEFFVTAVTLLLRHGTRPLELWRLLRGSIAVSVALYAPVTALIAFTYGRVGVEVLAFFVVPLIAAHLSFRMHARQAQLIEELGESNARLEAANEHLRRVNVSFAAAMVRALDSRDRYTAGHSAAVAVYSRDIAREIGLPEAEVTASTWRRSCTTSARSGSARSFSRRARRSTTTSGPRCDAIPRSARGSSPRWRTTATSPSWFAAITSAGTASGTPTASGHAIPRLARIIAVADSYNAMTSDRAYRAAMTTERAIQQLVLGKRPVRGAARRRVPGRPGAGDGALSARPPGRLLDRGRAAPGALGRRRCGSGSHLGRGRRLIACSEAQGPGDPTRYGTDG